MKSNLGSLISICTLVAFSLFARAGQANSIDVSYTITGTSGNYDLDFTVQNNLNATASEDIYFFGVELSARSVIGSPTGFNSNLWTSWNNQSLGGSNITYNNIWCDPRHNHLLVGHSLSGFQVHITDTVAPTTVQWFAFSTSTANPPDVYTGGGNFYAGGLSSNYNVGFEGSASGSAPTPPSPVPEPSTFALMGLGLVASAVCAYRRRKQQG